MRTASAIPAIPPEVRKAVL